MLNATVAAPDLTTFCRLDELGLIAVGQQLSPGRAVIRCRVPESDRWCRSCGTEGVVRDAVVRKLAHEPFGHRPSILLVRVRRYRCEHCGCTWRQDTDAAAERRAKISRRGLRWALEAVVVDHLTVSRVAAGLGVSWHTANTAILTEGKRGLIDDPHRFEGHLDAVFAAEEHVEVEATWGIYQRIVAAYREPDKKQGKELLKAIINARPRRRLKRSGSTNGN